MNTISMNLAGESMHQSPRRLMIDELIHELVRKEMRTVTPLRPFLVPDSRLGAKAAKSLRARGRSNRRRHLVTSQLG